MTTPSLRVMVSNVRWVHIGAEPGVGSLPTVLLVARSGVKACATHPPSTAVVIGYSYK